MSILEYHRRRRRSIQGVLDVAAVISILVAAGALGPEGFAGLDSSQEDQIAWRALLSAGVTLSLTALSDAIRLTRGIFRGLRWFPAWIHRSLPRRGSWLRWYHYAFREAPTAPDQAREALARLCGYRIQAGDHRILSVRPSIRRGRLGVWVTVIRPSRSTRNWAHQDVRWITDPHEWWLLRSAMSDTTDAPARPKPAELAGPTSSHLERLSPEELDRLVGSPTPGDQT